MDSAVWNLSSKHQSIFAKQEVYLSEMLQKIPHRVACVWLASQVLPLSDEANGGLKFSQFIIAQ